MSGAVPDLRFPEFAGEWKASKAGAAFSKGTAKGNANLPIYSVTMDRGLVPRDSLDRHMADDAADGANLRAEQGDIVYNTMRMWQGAAGVAQVSCMVSPAYVVLRPKCGTVSAFFNQRLANRKMLHSLWAYSHGLTSDRLRLYFDDFAQIPVRIPQPSEQQKIADFLGTVDAKLDALRRKKSGLEAFKSGLMQRLFSQDLRFTRDDGTAFPDWEEKALGDLIDWQSTNNLSREFLTDEPGDFQNIHYGDIHGKFPALFRQPEADAPYVAAGAPIRVSKEVDFCRPGDVVFADASEDYADIGKAIEIIEVEQNSLLAGLHTHLARPKEGRLAIGFSGYMMRTEAVRLQIMRFAQGISVLGISKGNLAKVRVQLPHPDEQRKIADALSAMDAKIAAVADQIAHMETFKKGLLQQMFV